VAVNGSANKTYVYDQITLRVFYTAPVSIEETHSFDVGRLVVYARLSSTDGSVHNVSTQLNIRAAGGILVASVKGDNATITGSPYLVSFDTNVERKGFTATILVFENDQLIVKKSFTRCASLCALANSNHTINNVGAPAYFNASKSHGDEHISTYAWDFGDNESEVGKVVSHLYSHYNWSGGRYSTITGVVAGMCHSLRASWSWTMQARPTPPHFP